MLSIISASSRAAAGTLVLAFVFPLSGCQPTGTGDGPATGAARAPDAVLGRVAAPDTTGVPPPDSILKLLDNYGRWLGNDRATIISRLGRPTRVDAPADPNLYASLHLECPWARFRLWRSAQGEHVTHIKVSGPLRGLPPVISWGSTTRSQVVALLGEPHYRATGMGEETSELRYDLPSIIETGNPNEISFIMVRDTVRHISWTLTYRRR